MSKEVDKVDNSNATQKEGKFRVQMLDNNPPRNLSQLYVILSEEIKIIHQEIVRLELEYYGEKSALDYLKSYAPLIKTIMKSHQLTELNSLRQIQSIIFLSRDPDVQEMYPHIEKISKEHCDELSKLQNQILSFVPGRFTLIMDKINKLQSLCEKYLLSFYSLESTCTVETAKKYAMNVRTWNSKIHDEIRNVMYNPHLFLRDAVSVARMQQNSIDLLRKTDLMSAPFMALFTDECEHLKEALKIISEWISYDRQYPMFVKTDMGDLDKQKLELLRDLKNEKHKLNMTQFRVKSLQAEKAKVYVDIESVKERESELLVEDESLHHEINQAKVDLEIKEFRKEEIRREQKLGKLSEQEVVTQLHRLLEQIRVTKLNIPIMERRQANIRSKIDLIEEKHKRHAEVNSSLKDTEIQVRKLRSDVSDIELALQKVEKTVDMCNEIYKLKVTPDILEKIFHGLPLETKKVQDAATNRALQQSLGSPRKSSGLDSGVAGSTASSATLKVATSLSYDGRVLGTSATHLEGTAFDQCCLLVAHKIERDWKRLYRALPFVPQRGRETIDKDIHELEAVYIGDSLFECAWRALQRWRRFHRRAKLFELRVAVERMRRPDIVDQIDDFLKPPGMKIDKEKTVPEFVDADLIPYYRQVDRYDELQRLAQQETN